MRSLPILLAMVLIAVACNKKNGTPDVRGGMPDSSKTAPELAPEKPVGTGGKPAKAKAAVAMPAFVAILLDEKYRTLRWGFLDSLRNDFPVIAFHGRDSAVSEGETRNFHFGTHSGEKQRQDLVLSYSATTKNGLESLVSGQAMDCPDGRSSFGQTRTMLVEKLGKPDGETWDAGSYVVSLNQASPDSSCYTVSIDTRALYESEYD